MKNYFTLLVVCLFLLFSCKSENNQKQVETLKQEQLVIGKQISKIHCSRCHEFPQPQVMPKTYWDEVLPIMGFHLGIRPKGKVLSDFNNEVAYQRLSKSGLFPEKPLITQDEWQAILNYYKQNAPIHLSDTLQPKFNKQLKLFKKEVLPWKTPGEGLTFLDFESNTFKLGYNSQNEQSYYTNIDLTGKILKNYKLNFPLVDVEKNAGTELLLSMGRMYNVDEPTGSLSALNNTIKPFLNKLQRPVDFKIEDFDNDKSMDILITEFGKYLGGINIYSNKGKFVKTNIYNKPGAINIILRDVNNDGLKDFYVLIAQENEGIYLFVNKGNLKFEKQQIISLPPYYGTTHFELLDFDNDGDDDVVCSSGDNDDFTSPLKPFQGIRIFKNKGNNNFEQVWFFKQKGAYGTTCADFDNDGDIDIASISYYASLENKDNEAFLYFENISNAANPWKFKVYAPLKTKNNCFMLIKAKDVDADGDLDILLGSNSSIFSNNVKSEINKQWIETGGAITILKNTTNK